MLYRSKTLRLVARNRHGHFSGEFRTYHVSYSGPSEIVRDLALPGLPAFRGILYNVARL